ncbi:TldD/PmbA family protein [Rivibacter subsaxonicus]|uniref:Putative Zn-dependent protease n=1 Tax=Rivibacter subsaxonicus TaxID=457575 RepID=A0A4Q7VEV5_9BURK|nr:TldD/PmbA family protein [Rivibacter subsaxonicus]RZT93698.1 putative Zn-dependent protease [Rivibacter subsaxonicus]
MLDTLEHHARRAAGRLPASTRHWAVRGVREHSEQLSVRADVAEAPKRSQDDGAMVTVVDGGLGYAATSDLSDAGLAAAFERAHALARASAGRTVIDYEQIARAPASGRYASRVERPASSATLPEKLEWLREVCAGAGGDARIVDRHATLWNVRTEQLYLTSDGARTEQQWEFMTPSVQVTASASGVTQIRSSAGQYNGFCQQGGIEVLERAGFRSTEGPRVAREALELIGAAPCPSGRMDLLLMPDQMMLQIHESIGHPLELDRILGDERNFAGTSFVTLDMFGQYQYGSELLNVSFDPGHEHEFAGFAFDDDGTPAERALLIERGLLRRPLGGSLSQARARAQGIDVGGVATTRSSSWNRAPIDRMSNLNVEPGDSSLEQMIASIELGVVMHTNCSWSIDDSRNKFQFGCEYARMVRGGRLAEVVRNPNYRGISATFWRSLSMVGNAGTVDVMGTPFCGKGEPSQVIRVGHASPACKFSSIDVFGGV